MKVTVLKDVMIDAGQIDRYFEGKVPVNLWRGIKKKTGKGVFDFVETTYVLSNGKPRPSDITIHSGYVFVKDAPRGVSVFNKSGVPKGDGWEYFLIPAGTDLPPGLAIIKDHYNKNLEATHYTIAPKMDMLLVVFKRLLQSFLEEILRKRKAG